jgi:aminopeptidase-like protein
VGNGKNINFLTKYKENLSYSFLTNFLNYSKFKFTSKNWSSRGSDERQFNSPNIDIPIICITKKKFGEYKQYHSSLDNLNFLKLKDLNHSISFFKKFLKFIEKQKIYQSNIYGEPFLSKRGLFSDISSSYKKISNQDLILNIYDLCDKKNLITDISKKLKINLKKIQYLIKNLLKNNLIKQL